MFKFFPDDEKGDGDGSVSSVSASVLRQCEEIGVVQLHYDVASKVPSTTTPGGVKYIKVAELTRSQLLLGNENEKVKGILGSASDLTPGEYEGGFKLWECTFDLLAYLEENHDDIRITQESRVLDLGCGHGILGLYALSKGGHVVFQDYNTEVLNFLTIPNVIQNLGDEGLSRSRFFGGSWNSFSEIILKTDAGNRLSSESFDVILSSETIYNVDYLQDLIDLLKYCLKPNGQAYFAAKTCYFGVGGGTAPFMAKVQSSGLQINSTKVFKDGVQREILCVTKIQS